MFAFPTLYDHKLPKQLIIDFASISIIIMHPSNYSWALNELHLSLTQEQANNAFKHWISVVIRIVSCDKLVFCVQCGNCNSTEKNFACGNKLEESDKKGTLRPRSFLQHTISLKFCRSNTRALTYFIPLYFTQARRRTNELTLLKSWKYTPILFTPKPRNKLPHYEEISW